ncbi:MAG: hypothetical protein ABII25_05830, partial [bacterium]
PPYIYVLCDLNPLFYFANGMIDPFYGILLSAIYQNRECFEDYTFMNTEGEMISAGDVDGMYDDLDEMIEQLDEAAEDFGEETVSIEDYAAQVEESYSNLGEGELEEQGDPNYSVEVPVDERVGCETESVLNFSTSEPCGCED